MKDLNIHKQAATKGIVTAKQRSYNEIVDWLDKNWHTNTNDTSLSCVTQLDKAFGNLSAQVDTILVSGDNGKSLTTHFTTKLLKEEGLQVGAFFAPHILTYNERFSLNNESIANKAFTELGNEVLSTVESLNIQPNSYDVLTIMALLYFHKNNVDVAVLEVSDATPYNATNICNPKVFAITRITNNISDTQAADATTIENMMSAVKHNSHVVSADQSKLNLQALEEAANKKEALWSMPIRKLAPLPYPFEQLHGRCAALAERVAYIYINNFANKDALVLANSLLAKQKGQRGRPTLEAKRQSELNPKRTLEQFWKDACNTLPSRFQLLDKEKPTILLDNASNIDALKNVLLGIRLLHYHRPLKGLTVLLGCNREDLDAAELLKLLRYFFKKTSGQLILCPVTATPDHKGGAAWDVEKLTNDIKSMKIKAKAACSFKEAFEWAQKSVDERNGLVVITGSTTVVTEYWKHKGMKKL